MEKIAAVLVEIRELQKENEIQMQVIRELIDSTTLDSDPKGMAKYTSILTFMRYHESDLNQIFNSLSKLHVINVSE